MIEGLWEFPLTGVFDDEGRYHNHLIKLVKSTEWNEIDKAQIATAIARQTMHRIQRKLDGD